jgi:protein SCO1
MGPLRRRAQQCFVRLPIVLSVLFGSALIIGQSSAHAASAVTIGGPFTLTAPDGKTVTDQTYRGKWLLVYFGYTSCPDSCPTALFEIATALRKLGPDAAMVQPIFITIDPQHDTPEIMGEYTQAFDPRFVGLTGTAQEIDAVSNAYGAYFVRRKTGPGAQDYVMDHSVYIYLMSPQGEFVRGFDTSWAGDRIAAAVREAMAQLHDQGPGGRSAEMRR